MHKHTPDHADEPVPRELYPGQDDEQRQMQAELRAATDAFLAHHHAQLEATLQDGELEYDPRHEAFPGQKALQEQVAAALRVWVHDHLVLQDDDEDTRTAAAQDDNNLHTLHDDPDDDDLDAAPRHAPPLEDDDLEDPDWAYAHPLPDDDPDDPDGGLEREEVDLEDALEEVPATWADPLPAMLSRFDQLRARRSRRNKAKGSRGTRRASIPLLRVLKAEPLFQILIRVLRPLLAPLTTAEQRFVLHLVRCSLTRVAVADGGPPKVPIPAVVLKNLNLSAGALDRLRRSGKVFTRTQYRKSGVGSTDAGHCFDYQLTPQLYATLVLELYWASRSLTDVLAQPSVDLLTGKPLHQKPPRVSGPTIPAVTRHAVQQCTGTIINTRALQDAFHRLQATREATTDPREQRRLHNRFLHNMRCVLAMKAHGLHVIDAERGLAVYRPCYRVGSTGRLFEVGGGVQTLSRDFKAVAYQDVGAINYDLRASQPGGLCDLARPYGLPAALVALLTTYVTDPTMRKAYAVQAGVSEEVIKRAILSLLFGASTRKKVFHPQKRRWVVGSLYALAERYTTSEDPTQHPAVVYERLCEVLAPFLTLQETWFQLLQETIVPALTHRRGKTQWLVNAVDMPLTIPDTLTRQWLRRCSSHLLQGFECALIYSLMGAAPREGFQVLSCEHDGLVVQGTISEACQATIFTRWKAPLARLEPKAFVKPLRSE